MNISETDSSEQVIKYLEQFGKVDEIQPIKTKSGTKLAKKGYFLSLYYNSSVEDKKFIEFCKKNSVIIQFDAFVG